MSLWDRWTGWRATPELMRRFLVEATWELLRARLLVAFGLRRSLPALLLPSSAHDAAPPDRLQRDVRYIIALAARTVPWESVCLPNAIAAKRMLTKRGYSSTLHLGVGYREAGDMHAHAWLEAGGRVITGEEGMEIVTRLPQGASHAAPGPQANKG